jgi:hypothetical protein
VLVVLDSVDHDRAYGVEGVHEMIDGGCRVRARIAGSSAGLCGADGQGMEACRNRVDHNAATRWDLNLPGVLKLKVRRTNV